MSDIQQAALASLDALVVLALKAAPKSIVDQLEQPIIDAIRSCDPGYWTVFARGHGFLGDFTEEQACKFLRLKPSELCDYAKPGSLSMDLRGIGGFEHQDGYMYRTKASDGPPEPIDQDTFQNLMRPRSRNRRF